MVYNEGVMNGVDLMDYLPFHLSALERSESMVDWIKSWSGDDTIFLDPNDWFQRGHDIVGGTRNSDSFWLPHIESGTYVWSPLQQLPTSHSSN